MGTIIVFKKICAVDKSEGILPESVIESFLQRFFEESGEYNLLAMSHGAVSVAKRFSARNRMDIDIVLRGARIAHAIREKLEAGVSVELFALQGALIIALRSRADNPHLTQEEMIFLGYIGRLKRESEFASIRPMSEMASCVFYPPGWVEFAQRNRWFFALLEREFGIPAPIESIAPGSA